MEYIGAFFAFVAAIAAICGETWDRKKTGAGKVTLTGWVIAGCALIGLGVSALSVRTSLQEKSELSNRLEELSSQNGTLLSQNAELGKQNGTLLDRIEKLTVASAELDVWKERAPIVTLTEGVRFERNGSSWSSRQPISTGAIVKLAGFNCNLEVNVGDYRVAVSGETAPEIPVIGPAGESFSLHLRRTGVMARESSESANPLSPPQLQDQPCMGKVQVLETERSASEFSSSPAVRR